MERAIIYTDGSCGKNKDGGWACLIATPQTIVEIVGWEENTTNNRMEMTAAIMGIKYLKEPHAIFLASDSAYLLNTLKNKWYVDWFEQGKDRKNLDLWRELVDLVLRHEVEYVKVRGHTDDLTNIKVDKLAVEARKERLTNTNVYNTAT